MKIDLGHGSYLEPDDGPRDTPFHRRIVRIKPVPNTFTVNEVTLECGHWVQSFGNLALCGGVVLCTKCRDTSVNRY